MKFTRLGTVSIIAMTTALTLSACVLAPAGDGTGLSGTIIGAGASSQQSAQEAWVRGFQLANVQATVEYDPIGSGGGRDTFVGGGAVFATLIAGMTRPLPNKTPPLTCIVCASSPYTAPTTRERPPTSRAISQKPLRRHPVLWTSSGVVDVIRGYVGYVISPEGQQAAAAGPGSAPISQRLFDKANAAVAAIKEIRIR